MAFIAVVRTAQGPVATTATAYQTAHFRKMQALACRRCTALGRGRALNGRQQTDTMRQFSNNTRSSNNNISEKLAEKIQVSPAVGAAALVFGGAVTARLLYGHLLGPNETKQHGPKRDESKVTVRLSSAALDKAKGANLPDVTPERLAESLRMQEGGAAVDQTKLKRVDAKEFASFITQQRSAFNTAKVQSKQSSEKVLRKELHAALSDAEDRISAFADWYFAYKTTYALLGIALTSAAKHAVSFRTEQTLSEVVTEEIQAHVKRKYEALVLRPAVTDPMVHRAFVRSLKAAHAEYLSAVQELEESVAAFVSKEAEEYSAPPRPDDVVMDMDWTAQMQKVEHVPLAYEKNPEISLAIVGAGAAAGKAAGGAAVGAAIKALSAKLAAPFATKAAGATLAKAATAGAAGGAALAGPAGSAAGAAAGAAIGLGVDLTVNAGVSLMHRSAFESDVKDSLEATRLEWEERLLPELERVQDVWFGHAEALLCASGTTASGNDTDANNE